MKVTAIVLALVFQGSGILQGALNETDRRNDEKLEQALGKKS